MLITDVRKMSNVIKSTKQHKSSFRKKNLTKVFNLVGHVTSVSWKRN